MTAGPLCLKDMKEQPAFLPMFWLEAEENGFDQLEVILSSGEGYVTILLCRGQD